jgi:quercetin dioxygenase-like cupin family protein
MDAHGQAPLSHTYFANLLDEVQIPADGITSRAIYNDAHTRVVLFGFDQGQELSEHTASMPAILHILKGEATLTFGSERQEASEGGWAYMPAHLPHSVVAKTPVVMLLTLQKAAKRVQS